MKKRKKIEEDAKRVVLPNAKNGIEIKEDAKYAKQLVSAMSSAYEVEDFWKIMGMVMFTSKNDFTIQDYPNTPFKIYIVYSNVNHKLSIRYKINCEETNEFTQTGHRWLEGRDVKVGEALKLIKDSGFLPPSVESISEINGDDIFDDLRIELSKYTDDSEDEEPKNIIKMNVKENRNMKHKQIVRIDESKLAKIVKESVKRVLKEVYYNDENYTEAPYINWYGPDMISVSSSSGKFPTFYIGTDGKIYDSNQRENPSAGRVLCDQDASRVAAEINRMFRKKGQQTSIHWDMLRNGNRTETRSLKESERVNAKQNSGAIRSWSDTEDKKEPSGKIDGKSM